MAQKPGAAPPLPKVLPSKEGSLAGVFAGGDGATVEVSRKVGKGWSRPTRVIADGNGFFGATRLKPGVYRVKVADQTQEIEIAAGEVSVVPRQ
jgi:hypothetical protein